MKHRWLLLAPVVALAMLLVYREKKSFEEQIRAVM